MPRYDFACSKGHVREQRTGMECREIACPVCGEKARRLFTITDPGRIRITEGFRQVTASMVCAPKHRKVWAKTPDTVRPNWCGPFGTTKVVYKAKEG